MKNVSYPVYRVALDVSRALCGILMRIATKNEGEKSLFYTTVEAETLLQKNVRVDCGILFFVPFLVLIKR